MGGNIIFCEAVIDKNVSFQTHFKNFHKLYHDQCVKNEQQQQCVKIEQFSNNVSKWRKVFAWSCVIYVFTLLVSTPLSNSSSNSFTPLYNSSSNSSTPCHCQTSSNSSLTPTNSSLTPTSSSLTPSNSSHVALENLYLLYPSYPNYQPQPGLNTRYIIIIIMRVGFISFHFGGKYYVM